MSTPTAPTDPRRRYAVLSRIQGLLSPQQTCSLDDKGKAARRCDTSPRQGQKLDTRFLKIRVVTWNMHDSLPKGDLQDLLGKVPLYDASAKPGHFPHLTDDTNHPFHLVVVAGQECPTPSGIPMGLGAGFKKEKLKNGIHDDKTDGEMTEKERREEIPNSSVHEKIPTGWTQLVEDWLCNGIGAKTCTPSSPQIGTPRPLIRQKSCREPRRGPYQLLIKDRLMGIYLALYVHRNLKHLVQGVSKSSVTAGLIGGRIGNKGGVGISLQLDGTTFLFLNAHLAAHEGKVNHRLANLAKIKTELEVDTFLASDDARIVAEDLTDKFDFTFLFGDLNFRLDISRLHADWLISRQEYAQALEFDQLAAIMKKGVFFDGFHEAYRKLLHPEDHSPSPHAEERQAENAEEDVEEGTDVVSLASSVTTINSRVPTESDDFFRAAPSNSTIALNRKNLDIGKGKLKWLSLLSPSFATSPKFQVPEPQTRALTPTTPHTTFSISPQSAMTPKTAVKKRFLRPPPMILANLSVSQTTIQDEIVEEGKGVYDTSSKQRVPSWCDRILWKTTIPRHPDPPLHDFNSPSRRTTRRVSQFFQALRSPSLRTSSLDASGYWTAGPFLDQTPPSQPSSPIINSDAAETNATALTYNMLPERRTSSAFSPPPTAPILSQRRSKSPSIGNIEQPRSASASIWRFLPAFLSPPMETSAEERQAPSRIHVRGDVVCLNYGTLDDKEMRRLEGRSDHRPVIGAYAVYL